MMYTLALSLHLPIPDPKYQPTGRLPKQYLPALYAKLRACLAVACDRNIVDRLDIARKSEVEELRKRLVLLEQKLETK